MKDLGKILALLKDVLNESRTLFEPSSFTVSADNNNLVSEYSNVDLWGRLTSFERIVRSLEKENLTQNHNYESAFIIAKEVLLDCYNHYLISQCTVKSLTTSLGAESRVTKLLSLLEANFPEGELDSYFEELSVG